MPSVSVVSIALFVSSTDGKVNDTLIGGIARETYAQSSVHLQRILISTSGAVVEA